MITLHQLSKQCEEVLNAQAHLLDGFTDNTSFEFVIHINEGEFKRASRSLAPKTVTEANRVTYHINALIKALSSDFDGDYKTLKDDGTLGDTDLSSMISASMSTSIEFLIPFPSLTKQDVINDTGEAQTVSFYETVIFLITSTLQQGWSADMTSDSGEQFLVGSRFTVPSVNIKDIRALAGESTSYTVYGDHFFVAQGVNSSRIRLYRYNDDQSRYDAIFTSTIGIARRSLLEPALFPDISGAPVSKNINQGSQLTISLSMPYQLGLFGRDIAGYIARGAQPPVDLDDTHKSSFKLEIPKIDNTLIDDVPEVVYLNLIFSDVGLNGAIGTAASVMVQLAEVWREVTNA